MSGRRQKLLRKQQNQEKIVTDRIFLKQIESLPAIPAEHVLWYLHTKFNGKTGYHYVSVSPYGSLFADTNYKDLVPIILHREFPVTLSMGRYQGPQNLKDCVIGLVRVPTDFVGIILSRDNQMYIKGDQSVVIPESVRNMYLCDLGRVTAMEYRSAIRSQQEYFDKRMMSIMDTLNEAMKPADPYDADPYDAAPCDVEPMNIDDVQADVID